MHGTHRVDPQRASGCRERPCWSVAQGLRQRIGDRTDGIKEWEVGAAGGGRYTIAMTQDERWLIRYNEVKAFIETNHRNPTRHRIEEHDMLNWIKANRKKMNAGELKPERVVIFQSLLNLIEENKRKNQYE